MDSILIEDGLLKPYYIKFVSGNYDIYKTVTSKRRGKDNKLTEETYQRDKLVGSASTLQSAMLRIINMRVAAGNKKVMTLANFYQNYRTIKEEVYKALKMIDETSDDRIKNLEEEVKQLKDNYGKGRLLLINTDAQI